MSQTQQMSPTESLERVNSKSAPKQKTRRPPNTAFRQQRLKAWQPILTPKTVIPLLFIVAVVFGPLGGLLLYASSQVQEMYIDYSQCKPDKINPGENKIPNDPVQRYHASFSSNNADFSNPANQPSYRYITDVQTRNGFGNGSGTYPALVCEVQFFIPRDIQPPVYLYYRLSNYYQNHRRYVQSYNPDQLKGKRVLYDPLSTCDPLRTPGPNVKDKFYYPCGLIANSYFNDSFSSPMLLDAEETYEMTNKGIAWGSDADLFANAPGYDLSEVVPPPNWETQYPDGYTRENPPPNTKTWEEFQNWMRTAGLPTFSKLVLRNDKDTLRKGRYGINITNNYDSDLWGGQKELFLSTRTVIGGKNSFLGIAYVVVAGVCVLLGTVFTITNLIKPRRLGDHSYLSWNNDKSAGGRRPHES